MPSALSRAVSGVFRRRTVAKTKPPVQPPPSPESTHSAESGSPFSHRSSISGELWRSGDLEVAHQPAGRHAKSPSQIGGECTVLEFFSTDEIALLEWLWRRDIRMDQESIPICEDSASFLDHHVYTQWRNVHDALTAQEFWDLVGETTILPPCCKGHTTGGYSGFTLIVAQMVENLAQPQKVAVSLGRLGRAHGRVFGADRDDLFRVAGKVMATLMALFGPHFTPELQQLWARVVGYLCEVMTRACDFELIMY